MVFEISLPYLQDSATGPYPKPLESSLQPTHSLCKTYFNINLPSVSRTINLSLTLRFPNQSAVRISHISLRVTGQSLSGNPNNIC
jgi:hypothetical protein